MSQNTFKVEPVGAFAGSTTPSFTQALLAAGRIAFLVGEIVRITDKHDCTWEVVTADNYQLVSCRSTSPCECAYLGRDRDEEDDE